MKTSGKTIILAIFMGTVFLFFTGGHWNIPIMAFLFSIPLLFLSRYYRKCAGMLIVLGIVALTSFFKNPGIVLSGFPLDQICSLVFGLPLILPFLADRLIGGRLYRSSDVKIQFLGTLVFPSAFALFESLLTLQPGGYAYSMAATQADNLPLLQLAAVTGGSGITFMVAWVGPLVLFVANYIESASAFASIRKYICLALSIFLLVFALGGARLAFHDDTTDRTCIAMTGSTEHPIVNGTWDFSTYKECISYLDSAVDQALADNAEMIVFAEESFGVYSKDLNKMKAALSAKAKESGIYIVAGVEYGEEPGPWNNHVCMFSPDGEIVYDYAKSILIPFVEADYVPGDGNLPVVNMKLGKNDSCNVSTAICFEGEYSHYMNTIDGKMDIHLNPSWEWYDACGFHSAILKIRSVEHGTSLVKPTYEGPNIASDYLGRNLVYYDSTDSDNEKVFTAFVPTHGVNTPFNAMKHFIPWIYLIPLVAFAIYSLKMRKKQPL